MFVRVVCLLLVAAIAVACGGSTIADPTDAPSTSKGSGVSLPVEPADSTTPPLESNASVTTVAPQESVTSTTQAPNTRPTTTVATSSVPSSTTAPAPTTTELRDFLTEEPGGSGLFLGTVEPDA